ncbi:unnamed protein product [Brachionus calyciflorus]|uniref:Reverse transcriptase domain-containing protein n=1 Tax=Brachionus calyciflorus TaxID=104777 RepID=A0A814IXP2_9BILA|nr:unnamed protein product [Brachionus calyciflorus]
MANVTPIFKKGDRCDRMNYIPVSITSVVCRIMEKIIRNILLRHLTQNGLFSKHQHGFIPNKSCTTNLLESVDLITFELWKGNCIDIVYTDFSKAFDRVNHRKLLKKLESYGIKGNLLKWIESFLSGRKQRVVLGHSKSEWLNVTSGVPQGSVLGPLLFALFINDLPDRFKNVCSLYADDCKIYCIFNEQNRDCSIEQLQSDIDNLTQWCNEWSMDLNIDKCEVIHIGRNNPESEYFMFKNDRFHRLSKTTEQRDLGVILTGDMKWSKQVSTSAGRANRILGRILNGLRNHGKEIIKKMYTSLVRPHLEYAVSVWNPSLKKDIDILERVQRRATRSIHGFRKFEYVERLKRLKLTNLTTRRRRGDLIQMYKLLNKQDHVNWYKRWENDETVNRIYETRGNRYKLRRELVKNCAPRFNFFTNRIVNDWNGLTNEVIESKSINIFKTNLDKLLKD